MNMTVERLSYLHENQIAELMDEIHQSLQPGLENDALQVRQAVTLVRNNAISSYRYGSHQEELWVSLNGAVPIAVRLSFDRMDTTCTCARSGWCSHRLAVVFHLYSQAHSLIGLAP